MSAVQCSAVQCSAVQCSAVARSKLLSSKFNVPFGSLDIISKDQDG